MESGLQGKVALITGGSSGIGLGIARALAAEGVNLAIASRAPDPAVIQELRQLGVRVAAISADVSREDHVQGMVRQTIEALAGGIDLYINNAAWAWHEPITRLTTDSWLSTMNTNLSACIWACREVARQMIAKRSGSILIIGSTAELNPAYGETSYRASKAGLHAIMEVLAVELAPFGIRVNMIIPGHYVTRLTAGFTGEPLNRLTAEIPLRRTGHPGELGPAAVLLLSDRLSSYTTGAVLTIDGGLHLRPLKIRTDQEILAMNAPEGEQKP